MKDEKTFLKNKFIEFQMKIAELSHELTEQENTIRKKEERLYLALLEIVDAFENIDNTIENKKEHFDKSTKMLTRNIRSVHKKLFRLIKSENITKIEFPENKASMDYCKVIDTREQPDLENETILEIIKHGYINKKDNSVLRKAEVITVLNPRN